MNRRRIVNDIWTSGFIFNDYTSVEKIYPHGFENYIVVVPNNVVTKPLMLLNIMKSPILLFWILLIVFFALLRCFEQWIGADPNISRATQRKMYTYTCQETAYLSCGVVTHAKLFMSRQYRQLLLVQGVTIIPMVAGMYFGGLLYGQFLLNSQEPLIDSIAELEQSGLTIVYPKNPGVISEDRLDR